MNKKLKRRLIIIGLLPLLLVALAIVALIVFETFQYTLIADIREFNSNVETNNKLEYGADLFRTRSCSGCHRIESSGMSMIGPNLGGIGERQTVDYIRESIVNPKAAIATWPNGDPYPSNSMPEFGDILDPEQTEALVAYVSTL